MLPDTVHKLPREERFAYARLLAYMARIDNELTVDEMAMFEQRLGTALLSPGQREAIRAALKNPPTLEECLAELSGEAGRLALRDAVMMAAADGTVDEDERDALEDISEHLGLSVTKGRVVVKICIQKLTPKDRQMLGKAHSRECPFWPEFAA